VQLHDARQRFDDAGVRLIVIGNGSASFIEGFRAKSGYRGDIYTDPGLHTYRALELRDDWRASLSLSGLLRALSAMLRGFRQTTTQGHAMQQGGVFVIDTHGTIVSAFRSQHAGHHPSVHAVVAAARRASGR
jgi:peroxiredoxin